MKENRHTSSPSVPKYTYVGTEGVCCNFQKCDHTETCIFFPLQKSRFLFFFLARLRPCSMHVKGWRSTHVTKAPRGQRHASRRGQGGDARVKANGVVVVGSRRRRRRRRRRSSRRGGRWLVLIPFASAPRAKRCCWVRARRRPASCR